MKGFRSIFFLFGTILIAEAAWGLSTDQLVVSRTVPASPTPVRVKNNPSTVLDWAATPSNPYIADSSGWQTLDLTSVSSATTNAGFLWIEASSTETPTGVGASPRQAYGWIEIRQRGQTHWSWTRNIGRIYDSDANNSIYMDGAHPPFLLFCPANDGQEIEYRYHFQPTTVVGISRVDYSIRINLLGYLEGSFKD